MARKPNILFLMTDQQQGRTMWSDHPCQTPNLDKVAARGVRIDNAYTPNAICSPARASLMTGLLPHNHGVLTVTHLVDDDQARLRTEHPHWAQRLSDAGYRTGYFGKWHVDRALKPADFGWQVDGSDGTDVLNAVQARLTKDLPDEAPFTLVRYNDKPPGYNARSVHYGVTTIPPENRGMGIRTQAALEFLDEAVEGDAPWCCFVSLHEPHDPFVCGDKAFAKYDVDALPVPPNWRNNLAGQPNLYRKAGRNWDDLTERQKKEAAACYYASITEIDEQFGRLLDRIDEAGQTDDTIIVYTSDHGELLGAHGLYCKNFSGFEEVYNIPMIVAGPGVAKGATTDARVGLHDLCPTLCEMTGVPSIRSTDSRTFHPLLRDPAEHEGAFVRGFAEYYGGRYWLSQRVVWDGPWKLCHNGFDFDELYNLDDDPYELNNIADDPGHAQRLEEMLLLMWDYVRASGDHSLLNTHYPILRLAEIGPDAKKTT